MLQIAICDDDLLFLKRAREALENFTEQQNLDVTIDIFEGAEQLKKYLRDSENKIDVLFMDIEMGKDNGIETAGEVNKLRPKCKIAFLTNYLAYATDIYEVDHFYYMIKSEFEDRLPAVFKNLLIGKSEQNLVVQTKGHQSIYSFAEICYVERSRRCCYIALHEKKDKVTKPFEEICEQLNHPCFVRCHNSFIANFNEVSVFRTNDLTMKDGTVIPISRRYREHVRECFIKWREEWM